MHTYITKVATEGGEVELLPQDFNRNTNAYTIVVGKNGVGKSRILEYLSREQISSPSFRRTIAISTSPFDRFPIKRFQHSHLDHYTYIGLRDGLYSSSSSVSLMASATRGLLFKISAQEGIPELAHIFHEMGLFPVARFAYKVAMHPGRSRDRPTSDERIASHPRLSRIVEKLRINVDERRLDRILSMTEEQLHLVADILEELSEGGKRAGAIQLFDVDFSLATKLKGDYNKKKSAEALALALDIGFVRLADVYLRKHELGPFSLKKASSGEQCLLVLLLGIAGHIDDDSLVLIDEPEISLHPKWQEDFMSMLMHAYSRFRQCQFVIATHSPQLVARLSGINCFVTSLTKRRIYQASEFSKKSADYQLAELFDAPGMMNEYISRLAFSLISRMKASGVDASVKNDFDHLMHLSTNIERGDPTAKLLRTVEEAFKYYATRI
ncbi:putative ATPase [Xanthomonas arboricola]